ncbi:MAG: cation:proton antiporter, partial [Luteibaculum sp.]
PIIWRSFTVALLALLASSFVCALVIGTFLIPNDPITALVYAIPLSIMSSAIIIPSVIGLKGDKKEFMVYEGTFSDILGIMFFYFLVGNVGREDTTEVVAEISGNILLTIALSIIFSYILVLIFQKIKTQLKLFLLIAVLTMLYAIGKKFHLSSLLIILVFGLVLNNRKIFFRGFLDRLVDKPAVQEILNNFHLITIETAFVVRTFFFVIFGMSIVLSSLLDVRFTIISLLIVLGLYAVRWVMLKVFVGKDILPELFIAPRGLITILLFFAIPAELKSEEFSESILLFAILATSIIMSWALVMDSRKRHHMLEVEDEILTEDPEEENGRHNDMNHGSEEGDSQSLRGNA